MVNSQGFYPSYDLVLIFRTPLKNTNTPSQLNKALHVSFKTHRYTSSLFALIGVDKHQQIRD